MGSSFQEPKHIDGLADPNYRSAFELYCDGFTYKEIASALDIDIFTAMSDVARESTLYAKQSRDNPQIDIAYANANLRKVIEKAWEDHGVQMTEDGASFNGLPIVIAASRELVKNAKLLKGQKFNGEEETQPIVPKGFDKESLRQLGRERVRQLHPGMKVVGGSKVHEPAAS